MLAIYVHKEMKLTEQGFSFADIYASCILYVYIKKTQITITFECLASYQYLLNISISMNGDLFYMKG